MKLYRFFWDTHKWLGISFALVFATIAVTGFLLLIKKDYAWIQPPTRSGASGGVDDFLPLQAIFARVLEQDHPDFRSMEDVDRIDFRPGKNIHKVRSKHNYSEIQVDAVSGEVLSVDWRPSDLLERIHDGSFFGDWLHDWGMPVVPVALVFLAGSGVYLWLSPILKRRRRSRVRS